MFTFYTRAIGRHRSAAVIALGAAMLASGGAAAQTVLTYTGSDFTRIATAGAGLATNFTTSDAVSGSLTLAAPLGDNLNGASVSPLSFSFTDGLGTVTSANAAFVSFNISTNGAGQITGWDILVQSYDPATAVFDSVEDINEGPDHFDGVAQDICINGFANGSCTFYHGSNASVDVAGGFSGTGAPVPEPAAACVLAVGLIGLAGASRGRVRA